MDWAFSGTGEEEEVQQQLRKERNRRNKRNKSSKAKLLNASVAVLLTMIVTTTLVSIDISQHLLDRLA